MSLAGREFRTEQNLTTGAGYTEAKLSSSFSFSFRLLSLELETLGRWSVLLTRPDPQSRRAKRGGSFRRTQIITAAGKIALGSQEVTVKLDWRLTQVQLHVFSPFCG